MHNRSVRRANRDARREARRQDKSQSSQLKLVDSNFSEVNLPLAKADRSKIEPKNPMQQKYWDGLHAHDVVIGIGEAGSGKTFLPTCYAAERLMAKDVEKIIVTRPVLQADEDLGFLPGDVNEKFAPYFRPVYDILLKRLGGGMLNYCMKPGVEKVEVAPFAFMRGRTFSDSVVILDEAQNVTVMQMKMFITRMGENTTVIINGDLTQCDLPKGVKSGLEDLLERIERDPENGFPIYRFNAADSVRSEICSKALKLYK